MISPVLTIFGRRIDTQGMTDREVDDFACALETALGQPVLRREFEDISRLFEAEQARMHENSGGNA